MLALALIQIVLAADNADFEAAIAHARAQSIDGPPTGAALTRREEDALLLAQFRARADAVQHVEEIAAALIAEGSPSDDIEVLRRVAVTYLEASWAVQRSHRPSYLTYDQAQLYGLSVDAKAEGLRKQAEVFARRALNALGPDAPEGEVLDTRQLVYETARPEAAELPRCLARWPTRAAARLAEVQGEASHLASDLAMWRTCLPAEDVRVADEICAIAAQITASEDTSMVFELASFSEASLDQLHRDLPGTCGVTDHPGLGGVAATSLAPPPPCLSTPARDAVLAQLDAAQAVEVKGGAAPSTADRAAAAETWLRVSRALTADATRSTVDYGAARLSLQGAQVAARRAGRQAQAARATPGVPPAEADRAMALHAEALDWWAFIQGIYDAQQPPMNTTFEGP